MRKVFVFLHIFLYKLLASICLIKDIKQAIAVHEELYGFPLPAYRFYGLPDCLAQLED